MPLPSDTSSQAGARDSWKDVELQDMSASVEGVKTDVVSPPATHDEPAANKMTDVRAVFNIIAVCIGAGILGLPYATALCGWVAFPILFIVGWISNYTTELLANMMREFGLHTYAEIGQQAFGAAGRRVILTYHKITLVGTAILYLVLAGVNLESLLGDYVPITVTLWILISGAVVLPSTWLRYLNEVIALVILGVVASLLAFVAIMVDSSEKIAADKQESSQVVVKLETIPLAIATMAFAFAVQVVAPTIAAEMKKPQHFKYCMRFSSSVVLVIYMLVAVFGYVAYGASASSPVTRNMKTGPLTTIAVVAVTVHVLIAFTLFLNPVVNAVEHAFHFGESLPSRILFRSLMTAACAGIGMAIPFFDDIMALLGAALMSFLVFVFPPLFRLKLSHSSMGIPHKVFCILVIVFGVLVAVVGTIEAVTGLSEHMK